jgi:hypothetical protein
MQFLVMGALSAICVSWDVEHGLLRGLHIRQMAIPRHLYLISRRGARLPHTAAEFMRLLKKS